MRRYGWFLSALAALCLAAPVSLGGEAGDRPKKQRPAKKKPGLRGEHAMMANVLKLDDETKAKFADVVKAGAAAMQEWTKANGAKWKEVTKALRDARKNKDKDKLKELTPQFNELRKGRDKVMADGKAKVLELLTDEQKAVWEGFILRRTLMRWFKGAKLTDEQKQQMQKLCEEKAKTMPAATDQKSRRARYQAMNKLRAEIVEKVLTDEQREAVKKNLPKPKPKRQRKPKPKVGADVQG